MSAVATDVVFDRSMPSPVRIAHAILEGFNRHYRLFRYVAQQAKSMYENADWQRMRARARDRIDFYDLRVLEAVARIER
jgi:isocitrate dehydrogenase kinase/phosphatase